MNAEWIGKSWAELASYATMVAVTVAAGVQAGSGSDLPHSRTQPPGLTTRSTASPQRRHAEQPRLRPPAAAVDSAWPAAYPNVESARVPEEQGPSGAPIREDVGPPPVDPAQPPAQGASVGAVQVLLGSDPEPGRLLPFASWEDGASSASTAKSLAAGSLARTTRDGVLLRDPGGRPILTLVAGTTLEVKAVTDDGVVVSTPPLQGVVHSSKLTRQGRVSGVSHLNLRKSPRDGDVVAELWEGTRVGVVSVDERGWATIERPGMVGRVPLQALEAVD